MPANYFRLIGKAFTKCGLSLKSGAKKDLNKWLLEQKDDGENTHARSVRVCARARATHRRRMDACARAYHLRAHTHNSDTQPTHQCVPIHTTHTMAHGDTRWRDTSYQRASRPTKARRATPTHTTAGHGTPRHRHTYTPAHGATHIDTHAHAPLYTPLYVHTDTDIPLAHRRTHRHRHTETGTCTPTQAHTLASNNELFGIHALASCYSLEFFGHPLNHFEFLCINVILSVDFDFRSIF